MIEKSTAWQTFQRRESRQAAIPSFFYKEGLKKSVEDDGRRVYTESLLHAWTPGSLQWVSGTERINRCHVVVR